MLKGLDSSPVFTRLSFGTQVTGPEQEVPPSELVGGRTSE